MSEYETEIQYNNKHLCPSPLENVDTDQIIPARF